jgi:hypothetical protein
MQSSEQNRFDLVLADPGAHACRVINAMLPYGVEAPVTEEDEVDYESLNGMVVHAVSTLNKCSHDGRMRIYRAISVSPDWEPETVGVHWTHLKERAIPYNGNTADYIVLEATVDLEDVHLYETIVLNMDLTEDEILLLKSAEVLVERAWTKDGKPSHDHLNGRTFGAAIPVVPSRSLGI